LATWSAGRLEAGATTPVALSLLAPYPSVVPPIPPPYSEMAARGPSAPGNTLRTVCKGHCLIMSEPFRPYEKLVDIIIMGKKFQVPERNSLLRCFQFISPETIPYGRFCWNQDCQYCRVSCQLPDDDEPREMLSCKFIVMPGMEITDLSQELKWCLRAKLPSDTPVSR
jgi:hypothetical protein